MAFKKKEKEILTDVTDTSGEVTYHHKGRMGIVSYANGINPQTQKPMTKEIKFKNHIYKTSDPKEIEELDEFASKTSMLYRIDEYKMLKASEPKEVTVEFGGKRYKMSMEALKDIAVKQLQEDAEDDGNLKTIIKENK